MPCRFDRCHEALAPDALAIFLFHGVIPRQVHEVRNYTRKHLQEAEFEAALRTLKAHGQPMSMPEVLETLEQGGPFPPRAYAVTFDDGFENNLSVAGPVLRRHATPATFYVCSSFVDEDRMSWTDQLECAFEHADAVRLDVPALGPAATLVSPEHKKASLDAIRAYVKGNPRLDPYRFAAQVLAGMGNPPPVRDRWLDRKLTWDQVGELARDSLFEVGAHGRSHRILPFLSADELERELGESISKVRAAAGRDGVHFSYPEGLAHCYSEQVIERLKAHGIRCSPTAIEGANPPGTDPFHLRRLFVV